MRFPKNSEQGGRANSIGFAYPVTHLYVNEFGHRNMTTISMETQGNGTVGKCIFGAAMVGINMTLDDKPTVSENNVVLKMCEFLIYLKMTTFMACPLWFKTGFPADRLINKSLDTNCLSGS